MNHPLKSERRPRGLVTRCSAVVVAALALLSCSATAGEQEPTATRVQSIAGGTADESHQNVFLLARETQHSGSLCTATLIAPNLLLTARHCVSPGTGDDHVLCGDSVLGDPYPASAFIATNDPQPGQDSDVFRAIEVRVPGLGVDTCGYDVALIILKKSVPASISTPAIPRIDREVEPGESYTAVGYGLNEAGDSPGARMRLEGLSVDCQPGSCGEGVESTEFLGETGICSGDSGGPALDADGKVVGVVSRGGPGCSTPIYSTVTAWHDFIIDTATEAARLGGYEPPFWVTTGLSDPPVVVDPGGSGGAGGAGAESGASEGENCEAANACRSGLVCYARASSSVGTCTALCEATTDCSDGLSCQDIGDVSVCMLPSGGADEKGGCAVPAPGVPASGAGWVLAALGALALGRRRR
ncbi:MAG TPA: S1 family peptidase [Polyangiaceae bacterium]|nr:S1 family peptidase [Polyangiaceae bacterium]